MIGLKRGPFAPLPEGGEIVLGLDARGGCAYLWRDAYQFHLGCPPTYASKQLNVVTIRPPGERSAPRTAATTCVADGHVALDTAAALGLVVDGGRLLWTLYARDQAPPGMFAMLKTITQGWRFPPPLRRLLPIPKLGELVIANNDTGGFYVFLDDQARVVVVVLQSDGTELQASVVTLAAGPFVRWNLTDQAREAGFDPLHVQFVRVMGAEAEQVAAYLADVADRGVFTFSSSSIRRRRKM